MFIKLLKNDFIQTGRMYLWLLGTGVAAGGIGALFTLNQQIGAGQLFVALLWNLLLILGALALYVLSLAIILVSTNRALFTERGYLTFALPVSSAQMLGSKLITNIVFVLLSIAEAAGLVYTSFFNMRRLVEKVTESMAEQIGIADVKDSFATMDIGLPSFSELMQFLSFFLVAAVMILVLVMMVCLFVLTVSHVRPFQAKPGLWIPVFLAAGAAACIWIVSEAPKRLAEKGFSISVTLSMGRMFGGENPSINMVGPIIMLVLSAGLFFLTNWLLSRKISLK
ncbi:MAG: hypothetical protein FWE98_00620 [Oscillospiraceae bacterium]|nr:hypothetical protein [Oscillospiraceae bacterium]